MVKRISVARTAAASTNITNTGFAQAGPRSTTSRPLCYTTKSASSFACPCSHIAPQTPIKPKLEPRSPSHSPLTQPFSAYKLPSALKRPVHDYLHKFSSPEEASIMYPIQQANSFMSREGLSEPVGFPGYGADFDSYASPDNAPRCEPLDIYPVPQSFQEAHSFSSSYWDPSDLPYALGPEYGGSDNDTDSTTLPYRLADNTSIDDQTPIHTPEVVTPIHTPEVVTPAASVGDEDKESSKSYANLIYKALMKAPGHQMVLQDIYNWFRDNTDKVDPTNGSKGWQNSIRHNLSMNEAFIKVDQDPPTDGRRTFLWALHPSVIGKGYVESTTRYRKSHTHKRASRGQQSGGGVGGGGAGRGSHLSQTSIPAKTGLKRNARKQQHGRPNTPPILPLLAPKQHQPQQPPRDASAIQQHQQQQPPLRPSPSITTTNTSTAISGLAPTATATPVTEDRHHQSLAGQALAPPSPVMKLEVHPQYFDGGGNGGGYGQQGYGALLPAVEPTLSGYPLPDTLYRGQPSCNPYPRPLFAAPLAIEGDFSHSMACEPTTPESLMAAPFPPLPKFLGEVPDVAVVEYGEPVFVPSRPSSLENMLLNSTNCIPGDHSVDCWQDHCRF